MWLFEVLTINPNLRAQGGIAVFRRVLEGNHIILCVHSEQAHVFSVTHQAKLEHVNVLGQVRMLNRHLYSVPSGIEPVMRPVALGRMYFSAGL